MLPKTLCLKPNSIFLLFFLIFYQNQVFTQDKTELGMQPNDSITKSELIAMTLDELLDLEIVIGTLTPSSYTDLPVAATIIDKNMIQATPARNIIDLLEVYVPGAVFVNHWKGARFGVRGVLGDQNTSYLLLVNGINANMKTSMGPFFEIQNRDVNDIESIEIIRGPGSVTYGHGAIGGIINIKTLKTIESRKNNVGVAVNAGYRYGIIFGQYGFRRKNFSLSCYGSLSASKGEKKPQFFYIDRAHGYGYGFMGWQWGNKGLGTPAPSFYGDLWGKPQKKLQLNMAYKNNLRLWLRYSDVNFIKQQQQAAINNGYAFAGLTGKLFLSVLEFKPDISEKIKFSNKIGFTSNSNREITFYQRSGTPKDDITQRNYSYSENEVFFETLFNLNFNNKFKLALGGDIRYFSLGPEWGMQQSDFINSFPPPLKFAVYDTIHSGFYQKYGSMGIVNNIANKIAAYQFSAFAETNIRLLPSFHVILSGRLDKHEFSEYAFSPRIALVNKISATQTLKLVSQKAMRLPTFNELYVFHKYESGEAEPEVKQGIELMYNHFIHKKWYIDFSVFYNSIDQIAWLADGYPDIVGQFDLIGTEAGIRYVCKKCNGGINYAFIKQTKWAPVTEMDAFLTNIGIDSVKVPLANFGNNRVNNIPMHSIKFDYNRRLYKSLKLHVNGRLLWNFGQTDMLESFKDVHDQYGTEDTREEMENIYNTLLDYGYTKPSFTSNVAISFQPSFFYRSTFTIYAMNLLQINHIRYVNQYWEGRNNWQYPRQIGFVMEPTCISFKWLIHT